VSSGHQQSKLSAPSVALFDLIFANNQVFIYALFVISISFTFFLGGGVLLHRNSCQCHYHHVLDASL
jgi:predicted permease